MSETSPKHTPDKLISQLLLEDADLRDIVEEFVVGMDTRLAELRAAHEKFDWDTLTMLAHRLKGAAGSYGYPEISELCATLERQFQNHTIDDFAQRYRVLAEHVQAARAGLAVPS